MISVIIQIRMGSTRLSNKSFLNLNGNPLIFHVIDRIKYSKKIDQIIVATTTNPIDNKIETWCNENNVECFRGSEDNVLKRYYDCAKKYKSDYIVRITGDDPFKDYRMIDNAIENLLVSKNDFVCNNSPVSFPEGLDVEVFTFDTLAKIYENANSQEYKEHVTLYVHKNKSLFKIHNFKNFKNLSNYRWTIDYPEDYIFTKKIYKALYKKDKVFLTEDIYKLLEDNPNLLLINNKLNKSTLYEK
jgi:spore coat polysaccharide biosynthesis protein SpsF